MSGEVIGFIGFGEVASVFSRAMIENGAQIRVYDSLLETEKGAEVVKNRIQASGIHTSSLEELVMECDPIISTVTTQAAKDVAEECAVLLKPGQLYIDMNSTSPDAKVELGEIVQRSGADFVEGVILGAVGATDVKTRLLTAGIRGKEAAGLLNRLGLNAAFYSPDIGKAAMFKMLRGIFSKGLEALLLEVLISGKRASIDRDLWRDIVDFMEEKPFEQVASNWIQSHAVAYERRYWEVKQILETMQEIGVEPIMTSATEAVFERSYKMGLAEAFPRKPGTNEEVIDYLNEKTAIDPTFTKSSD